MPLTVKVEEKQSGVFLITPKGRIDSETYQFFDKKTSSVLAPDTKTIIIDMDFVYYINSSGLGIILKLRKHAECNAGKFIITNLQPQIKKVFDVIKALPEQSIFESMAEVDKYLDMLQTED